MDDGPLGEAFKPTKLKEEGVKLDSNEVDRIIIQASINEGKPLKVAILGLFEAIFLI